MQPLGSSFSTTIEMNVDVPLSQEVRYRPGVLETLKFAWAQYVMVLVPVLCRLDIICARWVLCGRAASVRPPHHRPRESIWVAEAGRRLAAQQVWHRDGALWHHFSSSLTAVSGTSQYRCHSVPRSGPACHCWGCDHTEDPSGGLGGCQRVFSALLRVPQSTCFGALATLSPCVSMSLAIVFSDVLALVPLSGHPVTS